MNETTTALRLPAATVLTLALFAPVAAGPPSASDAYDAMGLQPHEVLNGSVLSTNLFNRAEKELVAMVTYYTGKRDAARAMNVRLEVFREGEDGLTSIYSRDFGDENGGWVARGEIQLVDLDGDGINEIILSYQDLENDLIRQRKGEVIIQDGGGFRTAWSGTMSYDATHAARELPAERRDRFEREVDVVETLRTRGKTLVLNKKVSTVAGERLPEPKIVLESYPLRR